MDLQQAMAEERKRLQFEIKKREEDKATLDEQITKLKQELKAIDAYERTKTGSTPGKRRSGIRQKVLSIVQQHPNGISRADLLVAVDAKGDKSAEQSVSNALAALKKSNHVDSDGGVYKPTVL